MFKNLTLFLLLLCSSFSLSAQNYFEVVKPSILSFESSPAPVVGDDFSSLSISDAHFKHQLHSLKWEWKKKNATLTIKQDIPYLTKNPNPKESSISTFIFWMYLQSPITNESVRFEFLKKGELCCYFNYGLDFKGWHGAWVAFDRDMIGKPQEGMDEVRIIAPNTPTGNLFLDHIILSSFQDARHHTAGFSSPFINKNTESHWLILLKSWNLKNDIQPEKTISKDEINDIKAIEERLITLLKTNKKTNIQQLKKSYNDYQITQNPDGTLKGKSIFFLRSAEAYYNLGGPRNTKWYAKDNRAVKQAYDLLFSMANSYLASNNEAEKKEIKEMYVSLTKHLLDQGFEAGSELGTLHHLGYSDRNMYLAHFLMKEALIEAHLDEKVQQAMEWFSGVGEVKVKPTTPGMDIDAFNTKLLGRISSILMMRDTPEKVAYLKAFSRWADNGYKYSDGTGACFKIDGCVFHHRVNYPAYAVGGFSGAVDCVWLLQNTAYRISDESHNNLKKALLLMRTYCNQNIWPLALSGRHPTGKGALIPTHYGRLATAGSPDGSQKIDQELASAYLRVAPASKKDAFRNLFEKNNIHPEKSPIGNWSVNYSCMNIHRRDDWSVTANGHSRYLWASEIYIGANHYGRYLNHGQLQILNQGDPISVFSNGFRQEGWDWNHFPGTTAAVYPIKELKANILNLDEFSGYEEELLSDEAFAGSLSLEGNQGMFAMKLHEHDKYNGSLRANKSCFFFDNRIVCLGSNIQNNTPGHPAQTTIYQEFLPKEETPIQIEKEFVTTFPFEKQISEKRTLLQDTRNNFYIVNKGDVIVSRKLQHSLDQSTDKPTENNFALAVINHGDCVQNGSYDYFILVNSTAKDAYVAKKKLPYRVLQQDKDAHIVIDIRTQTTGYACYTEGTLKNDLAIKNVNRPCMIMTHDLDSKNMVLSACDPDLHFYEGPSDDVYDNEGKRIERSIYSRTWINNPSGKSTLEITIKGIWNKADTDSEWTLSHQNNQTILSVICQHGLTKEIRLTK